MKQIVVQLSTPNEILNEIVLKVKEKQKLLGFTIKSISNAVGIDKKTYENFIYNNHITLINLIKLLKILDMVDELNNLIAPIEPKDEQEYKKLTHIRELNQRKKSNTKKLDIKKTISDATNSKLKSLLKK